MLQVTYLLLSLKKIGYLQRPDGDDRLTVERVLAGRIRRLAPAVVRVAYQDEAQEAGKRQPPKNGWAGRDQPIAGHPSLGDCFDTLPAHVISIFQESLGQSRREPQYGADRSYSALL